MEIRFILRAIDSEYWETSIPFKGKENETLKSLGYKRYASCPANHFEPALSTLPLDLLDNLANLIHDLDDSQIRILTYFLISQDALTPFGLKIGQSVWVNLSSPHSEYADNYFRCTVLKLGSIIEGVQYIYLCSNLREAQTKILVPIKEVLNEDAYNKKVVALTRKGLARNPKSVLAGIKFVKPNKVFNDVVEYLDKMKPPKEVKKERKARSKNSYEVS